MMDEAVDMKANAQTVLELAVTALDPAIELGVKAESVKLLGELAPAAEVSAKNGHIRLTTGMRFVIDKAEFLVGRSADNDLYIKDLRISRHHAKISVGPDGLPLLHNLSASTTTRVDREELAVGSQRPLRQRGHINLADLIDIHFTEDTQTVIRQELPHELPATQPVSVLELSQVSRQFPGDPPVQALAAVDLTLQPGEWLSITGPSGSGKSTLLNIIGCLDRPTSGRYRFDGIDTATLSDRERAGLRSRRIGFVFQSFHLLPHRSVLENVMLAEVYRQQDPKERRNRAIAALERVGLGHRITFLPSELSGGQRQRVAIARALIGFPSLLVCDEPTGNLDSKTTEDILDLFATLNDEGLTMVVVTHDENVAKRAGRRVQITDGQLVALPTGDSPQRQASVNRVNGSRINGQSAYVGSPSPAPAPMPGAKKHRGRGKGTKVGRLFRRLAPVQPSPPSTELSGITVRDLVDEAIAGMFARPGRMVLTMLGIVIGITALVATIGLSRTANNQIITQFDELAATEILIKGKSTIAGVDPKAIPWDAPSRIGRLNGVVAAGTLSDVEAGKALVSSSLVHDPKTETAFRLAIQAASPELFAAVRATLRTGRLWDAGHAQRGDRVAVLGPGAAARLGIVTVDHLPAIAIGDHLYLVIGILQEIARRPDMVNAVVIPEGAARHDFGLLGPEKVVVETRIGALYLLVRQIPYALRPDNPKALHLEFPPEPKRLRDAVESDLNVMILLLGGLSLVVGAIGIGNITLVSVIERTGEIGLRRAIGATRWHIAAQFLLESASMGIIGGILGAGLGILIVVGVAAYQTWAPVLDPSVPFLAPLVGGSIGLISGVYPALRAAQLEPVEAFRN
ncbi:MAG: ATP-binding cassette domain-containing protein [Caldilinea sp. CFX5]|nr:ATP-binding cassette domain-containing protein [Caldilinea sp. CFX5]